MDFSNDYCTKLRPKCKICIISRYCDYKSLDTSQKNKSKKRIKNIV